jgi:hypothetical protein
MLWLMQVAWLLTLGCLLDHLPLLLIVALVQVDVRIVREKIPQVPAQKKKKKKKKNSKHRHVRRVAAHS